MSVMLSRRYGRRALRVPRSWDRRYRKAVATAFATVPYYREFWSEAGLGTPTDIEVAARRRSDLIPLYGTDSGGSDFGLRSLRRLGVATVGDVPERRDPRTALAAPAVPGAVAHDPLLGHLAVFGECGEWHVAYPEFYVRDAPGGVAWTALRREAPNLVDIRVGGSVCVETCPAHRTPVLRP